MGTSAHDIDVIEHMHIYKTRMQENVYLTK